MKRMMVFAMLCALAAGLTSTNALAVTLDTSSTEYLGLINPGEPANETEEAGLINTLLAQPLNSGPTSIGGHEYTRSGNACTGCPSATGTGASKNDSGAFSNINVGGWTYLLAKYDGPNYGSAVWDVRGLTSVTVPSTLPTSTQYEISHYTLFNKDPNYDTPDGGMTLMLLGGALLGFETLRRKIHA